MSTRGLSTANTAQVDSATLTPVTFVEIAFDSPTGSIYLHDNIGEISGSDATDWGGTARTWSGLGDFGGISPMTEGSGLSPYKIDLTLSGIDATLAAEVLSESKNAVLRNVYIQVGFIGLDRVLVDPPLSLWKGKIDAMQVAIGPESVIRLTCESFMIGFEKSNGLLFSDADLQNTSIISDGDKLLQFAAQMVDANVVWGGPRVRYQTGAGGTPDTKTVDEIKDDIDDRMP
tara:strand:+ start:610 stop:1302 length:693 start_codon:yes stop_codon:yes gene_type:complete